MSVARAGDDVQAVAKLVICVPHQSQLLVVAEPGLSLRCRFERDLGMDAGLREPALILKDERASLVPQIAIHWKGETILAGVENFKGLRVSFREALGHYGDSALICSASVLLKRDKCTATVMS